VLASGQMFFTALFAYGFAFGVPALVFFHPTFMLFPVFGLCLFVRARLLGPGVPGGLPVLGSRRSRGPGLGGGRTHLPPCRPCPRRRALGFAFTQSLRAVARGHGVSGFADSLLLCAFCAARGGSCAQLLARLCFRFQHARDRRRRQRRLGDRHVAWAGVRLQAEEQRRGHGGHVQDPNCDGGSPCSHAPDLRR